MAYSNYRNKLSLSEKFGIAGTLTFIAFIILAIIGWVMNIFKLIGILDGGFSAWMVARIVGIFAAPLGAILGWL